MRPVSSRRRTNAAAPDRFSNDSRPLPAATEAYRTLRPALPTTKMSENAVFLHADPSARPYGIDDFVEAISAVADFKTITNMGPIQFKHRRKEMQQLASQTEIKSNGRRCLVIKSNQQEKEVKMHCMPPEAPDELLARKFARFGRVLRVAREGTTRVVHIIPREPKSLDAVPFLLLINGSPILVDVPGRPPMCLQCRQIGHIRSLCMSPWYRACHSFGHSQADCSKSYAARTRKPEAAQSLEEYRNGVEMAAISVPLAPAPKPPSEEPIPAALTHPPAESDYRSVPQKGGRSDGAQESCAAGELKEPVAERDAEASPTNPKPTADGEQRREEAKTTDVHGKEAAFLNDQPGGTSCDDPERSFR
ncbi:hypothetical protein HPB48_002661 [Haemaphysalis longicornis]|uniref:Uncharacterized protein n=1 Tax=Haemaphysalis longicornis TaxID=44386 RepID=A0A9J6GXN3_HAELO|nr:hypothetical protein HPB48_002661 [Haemaphysalis longicornis]